MLPSAESDRDNNHSYETVESCSFGTYLTYAERGQDADEEIPGFHPEAVNNKEVSVYSLVILFEQLPFGGVILLVDEQNITSIAEPNK